jgi:hypothetical protein
VHPGLRAADEKMRAAGVPDEARAAFARLFDRLLQGDTGLLHGDELEAVHDLPAFEELPEVDAPLDRAVVIKLNGGLGTSMGPAPEREGMPPPLVDLDPRYYKLLRDFEARFPSGPPSLLRAERLVVRGDVVFG